jgi:MFS transporter, putative metabolite:H+ symporter
MYSRWSTKWALIAMIVVTALGLLGVIHLETAGEGSGDSPVWPVALLIVGSNGIIAMLLPYAAENYPLRIRGRATGWVAGCSKFGGLVAQLLSICALVPTLGLAGAGILVPTLLSVGLIARFGVETRGRDLRELDAAATAVRRA